MDYSSPHPDDSCPDLVHALTTAFESSCPCACRAVQNIKGRPTREAAVKVIRLVTSDDRALAKHEHAVLSDLDGKAYVPMYFGAKRTPGHGYLIME